MLSFEEDVRYRTIVGDARMVRMGETVSGDSFTVMHMESGQTVLSLSDGMGSGEKAEKESNRIISLLEQLLTTGFNRPVCHSAGSIRLCCRGVNRIRIQHWIWRPWTFLQAGVNW